MTPDTVMLTVIAAALLAIWGTLSRLTAAAEVRKEEKKEDEDAG